MRLLASVGVVLTLTGCVPVHQRQVRFDEAEYAPYAKGGTATLTGQAFMKTVGGDVKYGAGNIVYLHPATKYALEWYEIGLIKGQPVSEADPRILKYRRETQADGEGRFKFTSLPEGEYIVACDIFWGYATGALNPVSYTGGTACAKVRVRAGDSVFVVVTSPRVLETPPPAAKGEVDK